MGVQGRLKDGSLSITGEVNERLPAIQNGLVAHYPFDGTVKKYIPSRIRYIRDWVNGNTLNSSSHWIEIQAIDFNNVNVALNKFAYAEGDITKTCPQLVDGNLSSGQWSTGWMSGGTNRTVDLQQEYTLKEIKVWHFYGDSRMYHESKTEVSQDGVNWFAIFDSAIEGRYVETSAGKTHNLLDLGGNYLVDTNTTLTNDFIAIEEATTNLAGQTISIYNNYNTSTTASLTKLNETYLGQPVYRLAITLLPTATTAILDHFRNSLTGHGVIVGGGTFLANTKYASSIYWRPVNKADTEFGGVASNMGNWKVGGNEYLSDGWRRYTRYLDGTMTENKSDVIHHSFRCPSLKLSETIYIDVCCPQTEQGRIFATSYTPASRSAVGVLKIPFTLKPPYTINFKHTGLKSLSQVVDQASSPMILQMGDYYTNASISFWNYIRELKTYVKGDSGSGWSGSRSYLLYTDETWNNKEHMYTFVAVDSRNFNIYMDGQYLGSQSSTLDVTNINFLYLGLNEYYSVYVANAKYRDLSLYNRALTDDEIKKLNGQSFNLLENGNLKTKIKEKPNGIPKDAIHIPLDLNSKDRLNILSASEDVNTVYEEGSIWVGSATKNEFAYPTFETSASSGGWAHWGSTGVIGEFGQNIDKNFIFSPNRNYSHWIESKSDSPYQYLMYQSPNFSGGSRALQAIICMSDGSEVNDSKISPTWNARNGGVEINKWTSIKKIGDSKWYLCKAEGISQDGSNNLVGLNVKPSYKVYVDTIQLENKPFCSPFTTTTRADSSLEFNLHRDYQLNWNENWSIVYWKKPVGTHANTLNAYNIDSLGSNSNSVGGGYLWWGKNTSTNSLYLSGVSSSSVVFNPSDYFNNWQMVSMVKSGSNITLNIKSNKLTNYQATYSSTINLPNWFVNQYGYDLKLGGHDNNYPSNTFFKDLIITKRALTDVELETLYKTQMRATKDGLTLQNGIKENTIL